LPAAEQYSDRVLSAGPASFVAKGEVDLATADDLVAAALLALDDVPPGDAFVLDLGAVTFMDCVGVAALLAIRTSSTERGRAFAISNAPQCVRRILSITGLDRELDMF
jgi:anti-anti-sigma factor